MNTTHPLTKHIISVALNASIWHYGSIVKIRLDKSLYEDEWHMLQDYLELAIMRGSDYLTEIVDFIKGVRAGLEDPRRIMWDGFVIKILDTSHPTVKAVFNYAVDDQLFLQRIMDGRYLGYLNPHWALVHDFVSMLSLCSPLAAIEFRNPHLSSFKAAMGEDKDPRIDIVIDDKTVVINGIVIDRVDDRQDDIEFEVKVKKIRPIYGLVLEWENGKVVAYPPEQMEEQDKHDINLAFQVGVLFTEVTDMDDEVHTLPIHMSRELRDYLDA